MSKIHAFFTDRKGKDAIGAVAIFALAFMAAMVVQASAATKTTEGLQDRSTIVTGSGERYKTIVERQTEGGLSTDDLHQASLLTARIVGHLNQAATGILDRNTDQAKSAIEKAQKLTKVVRDLLPVTTVTTTVENADGKVVYKDVDRVQDDRIALIEGTISTEVVDPVIDAKQKEAKLEGLRLEDADIVHTSVVADLGYIERKLDRAMALLDKPDEALLQLTLAQANGIDLVMNENDSPLVKVQDALELSEQMVQEGKYQAAQDNLNLAKVQLGVYRELVGKDVSMDVTKLEGDIAALISKTEETGAAAKIHNCWQRAADLFRKTPGEAHIVKASPEKEMNLSTK